MNFMTPDTALLLTPTKETAKATVDILFYGIGDCAMGKVLIARSVQGVCALLLGDDANELEADLAARFRKSTLVANDVMVRDDLIEVARFVDKPSERLDLTLDMRGTPLQRRVWEKIRAIPAGKTLSYKHLARLINCAYPQTSARVVANACAANPIALAIPCHRVIRSDGELAGYRWGLERKRELLRKEAMT
jgi:AraC family transcriptional regulator of adaptative response/methylated-DNA-[protein]-cysteine methyltransferase